MRLTVVGSSGCFPGPFTAASCYLVEVDGFRVLLDLGSGALGPLQSHVDVYDLDAILLSHLHPDHCMDLCGYYVARRYRPGGPPARIPVYGPAGTADRMAQAYGMSTDPGMQEEFDFRTYPEGEFDLGPLQVSAEQVAHPVEAYGLRVEHAGRVLTYSGDSGRCDALVRLAKGADLFLCEASFQEGPDLPADLHLTGREAADHAYRAGVGRLLLTHVPPWHDPHRTLTEAADGFAGAELARAGAGYEV